MPHHALALLAAGGLITVLHALGPDHWLPHVVVSRAQGWPLGRTLRVTALAAGGHVGLTLALGAALVFVVAGIEAVSAVLTERIMAAVLAVLGVAFVLRDLRPRQHAHGAAMSDGAATAMLLAVAAFPPCYAILPLFLAVGPLGLGVAVPLVLLFGGLTGGTMLTLVALGRTGAHRLDRSGLLHRLEARQNALIGAVFLLLAGLLAVGL